MLTEIMGNVIEAALAHSINVITHSCNCFCKQKSGIAVEMVDNFRTDRYLLEQKEYMADMNKLGQIDLKLHLLKENGHIWVVNSYCQYHYSDPGPYGVPLDYDALRLCFRKLNSEFRGNIIGVPGLIGAGLAKGNPKIIRDIITQESKLCKIIAFYLKDPNNV